MIFRPIFLNLLTSPLQNISHSSFSRYLAFAMYLDAYYMSIYIVFKFEFRKIITLII